jgi:hypothetical protein
MMWAVHPEEDRFLNAREFMHLMGLPYDFEIDDVKNCLNHIAQNVTTNTARGEGCAHTHTWGEG